MPGSRFLSVTVFRALWRSAGSTFREAAKQESASPTEEFSNGVADPTERLVQPAGAVLGQQGVGQEAAKLKQDVGGFEGGVEVGAERWRVGRGVWDGGR